MNETHTYTCIHTYIHINSCILLQRTRKLPCRGVVDRCVSRLTWAAAGFWSARYATRTTTTSSTSSPGASRASTHPSSSSSTDTHHAWTPPIEAGSAWLEVRGRLRSATSGHPTKGGTSALCSSSTRATMPLPMVLGSTCPSTVSVP